MAEAARLLDTTVDALRKRIQRRTIEHERDEEGRVWILVDESMTRPDTDQDTDRPPSDTTALISRLEDEVRFLREELARKDAIMLRMAENIGRELEAPSEPLRSRPESVVTDEQAEEFVREYEDQEEATERRWWEFWR